MLAREVLMEEAEAEFEQLAAEHGPESEEATEAYADFLAKRVEYEVAKAAYERAENSGEPVEVQIAYARYQAAKSAHDAANVQYNIARNNLDLARGNIEQTKLVAALDGTVVKVVAGAGDLATPPWRRWR